MTHKPPEVRYDAEMPPGAQKRFTAFMETLNEHPNIMRTILDQYPDDDLLITAALTADQTTNEGKALSRLGSVLANDDHEFVEPDEAFHTRIDRILDRAEHYNTPIDRRRTWFSVLVQEAQLAKGTAAAVTPPTPVVKHGPATEPPAAPATSVEAPLPVETYPTPEDDTPVDIRLIPADGKQKAPIAPVIFMAPEYPE